MLLTIMRSLDNGVFDPKYNTDYQTVFEIHSKGALSIFN